MAHPQHETARGATFGFTCRACSKCCPHKYIQVNPYEVARLARFLNLSTTAFLERFTEHGGAILKRNTDDACVFLNGLGCGVHPARPLVCRLYPLGRRVAADGSEEWVKTEPHPESKGEFHSNGTIAGFIAAQGAEPFLAAADAYVAWVRAAGSALEGSEEDPSAAADILIDMDAAIAAYGNGAPEPADIEARTKRHLDILYQFLGGQHD
jgi:Fe-S-cluster containining protein